MPAVLCPPSQHGHDRRAELKRGWWLIVTDLGAKMRQKAGLQKAPRERFMEDTHRATCNHHGAEEKISIVLQGLRGEELIEGRCQRDGIAESLYSNSSTRWLL